MNIQMSELVMSSPHNLSYILYMKFWKFSFFFPPDTGKKHILVSKYIRINIISHLFWVDIRQGLHSHSWNMRFLSGFVNEMCRKLWGDDIINSLIWIFIRTGQEMFSEKIWNFKMSQLPYFLSDFHHFCTICRKFLCFLLKLWWFWTGFPLLRMTREPHVDAIQIIIGNATLEENPTFALDPDSKSLGTLAFSRMKILRL